MITLAKLIGGSHLYQINTPESDIDERYVFLHTDPEYIFGLEKFEHHVLSKEEDKVGYELRKFLLFCRKSNTQCMETLFLDPEKDFVEIHPFFENLIHNRNLLIDPEKLFKSLCGYLYNEYRLTIGERTGLLGSKRKQTLEKYGYSYKNFANLIRLARCGEHFFKTGIFPTRLNEIPQERVFLRDLRSNPEKYTMQHIRIFFDNADERLKKSFNQSKIKQDFRFDEKYANHILEEAFYQIQARDKTK